METEKDELIQEVFRIHHSDIPKGISSCRMKDHQWVKLSDNEVRCAKCPVALIVNPDYLKELLCQTP